MKEHWNALPIGEIEAKLNTSAASGLSRKAAREQFQKAGENAFFLLPQVSILDGVRTVAVQPSVVLLFVLTLMLFLFDQIASGAVLLGLTLLYVAWMILLYLWTERIHRISARTMRPQIRVIREGQLFSLDSTRLVPGDLIELEQGEIVPCDLRIISAQELRVLTYLGRGKEYVRSEKNTEEVFTYPQNNDICKHTNMLYGGSVIEHGYARALVVETGRHTYIGALQGGLPFKTKQALPEVAQRVKKIASYLQIGLLFCIFPILCMCLLLGNHDQSLPMLFSTLLCLCLANLVGHMELLLHVGMAIGSYRALGHEASPERALIKTDKSPDLLSKIDVLLLLGPQAFSEQSLPITPTQHLTNARDAENDMRRRELQLVMSENFLSTREDLIRKLREDGIQPLLLLEEESRQSITYVMRTGIVESSDEIAMASQFRAQDRPITAGFGKYFAYCGFSMEEIHMLMIRLQKSGKKVAVLGNLPRETTLLKRADVSFSCINDLTIFTDSNRTRESKPQISRGRADVATPRMRQYADVLIPCADRRHGGLSAIVHTIHAVSDTARNLTTLSNYLIYTQLARMTLILPTLLAGLPVMTSAQILFSGLCVDLLYSFLLLMHVDGREGIQRRRNHATWRSTAIEAISASMLMLVTFLFIYYHDPNPAFAPATLFASILLIQFSAFLLHWDPIYSLRKAANRRALFLCIIACPLLLLIAHLFGIPFDFAVITTSYRYVLLSGPLAVLIVAGIMRIYRMSRVQS